MRTKSLYFVVSLFLAFLVTAAPAAAAQCQVNEGTHFMVELRDTLDASRVHAGQEFEARTVEALPVNDCNRDYIPAGARLRGRVSSAEHNKLMLRFERIDTPLGRQPIVATVVGVPGEKNVHSKTDDEGEISATSSRGKRSAIGAVLGAGAGAAIGGARGGGEGAAIGAGAGAGGGALIGASSGTRDLVLQKGARIEVQLDRPLVFNR